MNPLKGIAFKLISVCLFMAMDISIKSTSPEVPTGEVMFFRSAFAIPVIVIWLAMRSELATGFKTSDPMGHFWRGLVGVTAMGLGFYALRLLPLPEVVAIGFASPLLMVIFGAMFLNEEVRMFRLSAVAIGMIGVIIILAPRLTVLSEDQIDIIQAVGAMAMLLAAVFRALAQVFVRKLVQVEHVSSIVFYFSLSATFFSLLTIPFGWVFPSIHDLFLLVFAGLIGGISQIFMTMGYRYAPLSVVAPFEYTAMLLSIVAGYFLFSEWPSNQTLTGATLIIVAGLFIIWRERKLGIERSRARASMSHRG